MSAGGQKGNPMRDIPFIPAWSPTAEIVITPKTPAAVCQFGPAVPPVLLHRPSQASNSLSGGPGFLDLVVVYLGCLLLLVRRRRVLVLDQTRLFLGNSRFLSRRLVVGVAGVVTVVVAVMAAAAAGEDAIYGHDHGADYHADSAGWLVSCCGTGIGK